MSNMSGGRWNSPAQNADAFMSPNGASCCQAISYNSHRWRKQGTSLVYLIRQKVRVDIISTIYRITGKVTFNKKVLPRPRTQIQLKMSLDLLRFAECYVIATLKPPRAVIRRYLPKLTARHIMINCLKSLELSHYF